MDKKYQVFISSTYLDLKDERAMVLRALLGMGYTIPAGMELFPATNSSQWTLIEKVILDCDYYILIVGGRYGSIVENEISFTMKEYDYAKAHGIPVLAFLRSDIDKLEKSKLDSGENLSRLQRFRDRLEKELHCKFWSNDAELVRDVLLGLGNLIQEVPAVGWIRGDQASDPNVELQLRKEISDLKSSLDMKGQQAIEIGNLANGKDETKLACSVPQLTSSSSRSRISITTTWNEIISAICPDLFAGKYDYQFQGLVKEFLRKKAQKYDVYDFEEAATKIKVQLLALGLIHQIGKVALKMGGFAAVWELTAKGQALTSALIAEKKV